MRMIGMAISMCCQLLIACVDRNTRWWKELDFERKMPFARHRIVECFFWMVGMYYYEPKYSVGRMIGTKLCAMATMLDDIFDSYGTFEELKIFRQVIERLDMFEI